MSSRLALAMSASALVVAVLGSTPLGHAVTSALPRNSVGPLQLKRNAVGPQKVAPNAVRTAHILNGSLLAVDFKAGQLPAGAKGDKGDPGPVGVSDREIVRVETAIDSASLKQAVATCPAGKVALGGGGNVATVGGVGAPVAITQSVPAAGPSSRWLVLAREINPTNLMWSVSSAVVCARVD